MVYPTPAPPSVNAVTPTRRVRAVEHTVTAGSPGCCVLCSEITSDATGYHSMSTVPAWSAALVGWPRCRSIVASYTANGNAKLVNRSGLVNSSGSVWVGRQVGVVGIHRGASAGGALIPTPHLRRGMKCAGSLRSLLPRRCSACRHRHRRMLRQFGSPTSPAPPVAPVFAAASRAYP